MASMTDSLGFYVQYLLFATRTGVPAKVVKKEKTREGFFTKQESFFMVQLNLTASRFHIQIKATGNFMLAMLIDHIEKGLPLQIAPVKFLFTCHALSLSLPR